MLKVIYRTGQIQYLGKSWMYILRSLHGSLMILTWSVFTVVAAIIARYYKSYPWWYDAHRVIQGLGTVFTFPIFLLAALSNTTQHFSSVHAYLGLTVIIMGSLQGFIATVFTYRDIPILFDITKNFSIIKNLIRLTDVHIKKFHLLHSVVGKALVVYSLAVIYTGMIQIGTIEPDGILFWLYRGFLFILFVAVALLELHKQKGRKKTKVQPINTLEKKDSVKTIELS